MPSDPDLPRRGWTPPVEHGPDPEPEPEAWSGADTGPSTVPSPLPGGTALRRPAWWRRVGRGGRFVETWVPETLRDARLDPGRRGALVLSLVAALAAVAAAVGVWRDRPEPRPVQTVSGPAVSGPAVSGQAVSQQAASQHAVPLTPASPGGSPIDASTTAPRAVSGQSTADGSASASPTELAVSVTGAVRHPGLVRIAAGGRVADAIAAAGGTTADADITGLNLATVLADGDSVVVGTAGSPGVPSVGPGSSSVPPRGGADTTGGQGSPLDLNTADDAALQELPGVGPVMAGNIIAWRDANGGFRTVDQLQEIPGIGPARFAQLSPLVTVG